MTLRIENMDHALGAFADSWRSGKRDTGGTTIGFSSWELMHRLLAPKRLEILRALCGQDSLSIRELSRRLDRDFKGVHTDVASLLEAGIIDKNEGGVRFPYDRIHVEFDIEAAA
ncbi:HVO_A0114 family putative DNA-binding protein [Rhizobium sp. GN54]|uniref:HVO_A0114 family putative DNA-binding protein n=1 Tax=Rhizobium sp. GN54 TaxID=2898150 RepID=UPI001E3CE92C|nr:helix-turn-helix domain-containing protein [Rhizobium sp. GN54]MCD2184361.1 helix-turn-helix domain-containing protein [Rhizobium sp. GN54]